MPIDGIEPPTFALQERRSTTKPNRHTITSCDKNVLNNAFLIKSTIYF